MRLEGEGRRRIRLESLLMLMLARGPSRAVRPTGTHMVQQRLRRHVHRLSPRLAPLRCPRPLPILAFTLPNSTRPLDLLRAFIPLGALCLAQIVPLDSGAARQALLRRLCMQGVVPARNLRKVKPTAQLKGGKRYLRA